MNALFLPGVAWALAATVAVPASAIDFPCMKNVDDGRFLVDGPQWDQKMRELGYVLEKGGYVPYDVERFTMRAIHDRIWVDGMCRMKLLPLAG